MRVLGITGPIASGKTTVMGLFAQFSAWTLAADDVHREITQPGSPVVEAVRQEFGPGFVDSQGRLDRGRLGRLVFDDADALARLNAITHPPLKAAVAEHIRRARQSPSPPDILVFEAATMAEMGALELLDGLVYVDAPAETRVQRLCATRDLTLEEATSRVAAQEGHDLVAKKATWILNGTLDREVLREAVRHICEEIRGTGPSG